MSKRRTNGEGSIYKRADGQWCSSATIGYDENGKRRRRTVYGRTKIDVAEKLARLNSDSLSGTLTTPGRLAVAAFMTRWLEDSVQVSVREKTFVDYSSIVRNHINPSLGGMALNKLSPTHVQSLYANMQKNGSSDGLRRKTHAVLRRALSQALKWGLISRNPCDSVDKPKASAKRVQPLSPKQVPIFLTAATEDRFHALYVSAITTGLRLGELLGLKWDDVDLQNAMLSVTRTVQEVGSKMVIGEPKTAKSRRRVSLPKVTIEALKEHRKKMLKEDHGSWVFCDTDGNAMRPSNLRKRSFKPILKAASLPDIRFHDLRHTAATLLFSQGVHPKIAQERLGHSQISITLDTYSHMLPTIQSQAVDELNSFFRTTKKAKGQ